MQRTNTSTNTITDRKTDKDRFAVASDNKSTYRGYVRYVDDANVILRIENIAHLHCYVSRYIHLCLILQESERKGGRGWEASGSDESRVVYCETRQDNTPQQVYGKGRTSREALKHAKK